MAGFYGNQIARNVRNGICKVGPGAWTQLTSSQLGGVVTRTNLEQRQWISLQARGPGALALTYTSRAINGDTFATTVPAYNAHDAKIIPANTVWTEPLSDDVMLWGRFQAKAGSTAGGMKVVVTEYA